MEILNVLNLNVSFVQEQGVQQAVKNLSFQLTKGETLGIAGESGSGKSVTSLALMGLLGKRPVVNVEGVINYTSKDGIVSNINQLTERDIRKLRGPELAMVFQEPMSSLNPVLTCGEQVAEAIRLHLGLNRKEAKEEVLKLFSQVQLQEPERCYHAYPHQLSGGQKQRVMIAIAISCRPQILIADEPTTALDVSVQAEILELLATLKSERGMSMIFITHDLGVLSRIADRIMVMYQGRAVESGSKSKVFISPENAYTKGLLACRPSVNMTKKRLPVLSDFIAVNNELSGYSEDVVQNTIQTASVQEGESYLLKAVNLGKNYALPSHHLFGKKTAFKALDSISFEIYKGETLGLVGESGSGKTTLGRVLLRLIEPSAGSITYQGQDLLSLDNTRMRMMRKKMQLIFQDPYSSLNPRMRIGHAIAEPMLVHNIYNNQNDRKQKVMELLRKVGLNEEHFYRYPYQFSGGQRQRICIARALALNPEFIICDESVSALDVSVQAQVLNLLNDLKEENGLTYIFISHDLSVVRYMSDRIMVMNRGRIEEIGPSEELYSNPQSAYTRKLIAAINN